MNLSSTDTYLPAPAFTCSNTYSPPFTSATISSPSCLAADTASGVYCIPRGRLRRRSLQSRSVNHPSFWNAAACAASCRSSRLQATMIKASAPFAAISGSRAKWTEWTAAWGFPEHAGHLVHLVHLVHSVHSSHRVPILPRRPPRSRDGWVKWTRWTRWTGWTRTIICSVRPHSAFIIHHSSFSPSPPLPLSPSRMPGRNSASPATQGIR